MSRITKIIALGAIAFGVAGLTIYASIAPQPTETAAKAAPAVFTSGGNGSCCTDGAAQHTMAQNALFTPKVNAAAATQGTCPYTGKTAAMAAGAVCPEAATMASNGACDIAAQNAALTASAAGQCPMQKTATTATMTRDCSSCPEAGAMASNDAACTAQKTTLASAGACCASEGAKTKADTKAKAKMLMADTAPAAKTAN